MKKIYFYTIEGKIVSNYDIASAARNINGEILYPSDLDAVRKYAETCKGIKEEITEPTVEIFLEAKCKAEAICFFREEHPELSLKEAKEAVDKLEWAMLPRACEALGFCPYNNTKEGFPCPDCPYAKKGGYSED